jgi:hypothetical protein
MARLHEYQGKAILAANGFKVSRRRAASTADEAVARDAKTTPRAPMLNTQRFETAQHGCVGLQSRPFSRREDKGGTVDRLYLSDINLGYILGAKLAPDLSGL